MDCIKNLARNFNSLKNDKQLLRAIKNIAIVLVIGFASANTLSLIGFDNLMSASFSMGLMLISTDGFLTVYALRNGFLEANPIMNFLNEKIGETKGILVSRAIGFIILSGGLITNNAYFCLAIAWMFCFVVCFNSVNLASKSRLSNSIENRYIEDSSNSHN
jgi:hypothetical protein